jgi:hypothetical protein
MAIGDIIQCTINQDLHSQVLINSFHYVLQSGTGDLEDLLTIFRTAVANPLLAIQSDELFRTSIVVQHILPFPRRFPLISALPAQGSFAGISLPTSVAGVVSKQTDFAGRSYRGRWYIGGIPVVSAVESKLTPAAVAAWDLATTNWATTLVAADGTNWRASMLRNAAPPGQTPILEAQALRDIVVRPILRNQRRRQVGIGI